MNDIDKDKYIEELENYAIVLQELAISSMKAKFEEVKSKLKEFEDNVKLRREAGDRELKMKDFMLKNNLKTS